MFLRSSFLAVRPFGVVAGQATGASAFGRPSCCDDVVIKAKESQMRAQPDSVTWVGGCGETMASRLKGHDVRVVSSMHGDGEAPIADPRNFVVSRRSFNILKQSLGSEDDAVEAVINLLKERALFHKLLDDNVHSSEAVCTLKRPVLLIGISGPSCSGKSTVAKKLANLVDSPIIAIRADSYFDVAKLDYCKQYEFQDLYDYEQPEGISWKVLLDDLRRISFRLSHESQVPDQLRLSCPAWFALAPDIVKADARRKALGTEPVILVIEGFLMFASKEIADLCALRIFLEAGYEECLYRRWQREGVRHPDRWDLSAGEVSAKPPPKFERWFKDVVWAAYEQHLETQASLGKPWFAVDADASPESVERACSDFLRANLPSVMGPDLAAAWVQTANDS